MGKHPAAVAWPPVSERDPREGEYDALEDEFAHLFRDEARAPEPPQPPQPPPAAIDEGWEPLVPIPIPTDGVVDPPLPPPAPPAAADELVAPVEEDESVEEDVSVEVIEDSEDIEEIAPVEPPADPAVGRLFRSRGATETPEAITAVGSMQARRLRTMARSDEAAAPPEPAEQGQPADDFPYSAPAPAPLPVAASGEPAPALEVMANRAAYAPARPESTPPTSSRPPRRDRAGRDEEGNERGGRNERGERTSAGGGTLTGLGVYAVTIGVTVILAFGETLFFGGEPGAITGIGLLVVSVFAAFAVRTRDAVNAIFAPPIAFFIAAITAGQFDVTANDLSGRAVALFFLLGASWIWIVGSTVAALVIVALRRRLG